MFWQKLCEAVAKRLTSRGVPVRVRLWNGTEFELGENPRVTLEVVTPRGLRQLLNPTLDRLGRAYVEDDIRVEGHATDIVAVAAALAGSAPAADRTTARRPRMLRHTRHSDAAAITYHYDVSNEFYSLWLDPGLVYSCAYFRNGEESLEIAQQQKIDHILRKLRVRPGDTLLDIGCGWGALVMRAAEKFGARAVGITLSRNQHELAHQRIRESGLAGRCEVRLEDYRDVTGRFDRIASVGMFEHVGLRNLREYFARIRNLLTDDGVALNHGITSVDPDSGESPCGGGDFIDRYVFPHGELPHLTLALKELCAAGLEPVDIENLRRHYALTLCHWTERFEAAAGRLRELAGERRWRIWRIYLAGCAYAFTHNWISVHQILAVKSSSAALPLTRDYMYRT